MAGCHTVAEQHRLTVALVHRIGHRRVFLAGITLSTVASLAPARTSSS
ncbi:hypothetical protein [Micromonospora sp. NPDC005220]